MFTFSEVDKIKDFFPPETNLIIYSIAFVLMLGFIFASWILGFINKISPGKFIRAKSRINELSQSFHALRNEGVYYKVVILSLFVTLINIATFYYYFHIFDIHVTFLQAIFCLAFLQISVILPVHGVGKFGTFESIAILAFLIIGVPKNSAIILAFAIHIISLIFYSFLALIGYCVIRKNIFS